MLTKCECFKLYERFGGLYLQKPPFLFCLSALSFYLLSINDFIFRIPHVFVTLFSAYHLYKHCLYFHSKSIAKVVSFVFLSFIATFFYKNDVCTDTLLMPLLFTAISKMMLYFEMKSTRKLTYSSVFLGFAILTKGRISIALFSFAIIPCLI